MSLKEKFFNELKKYSTNENHFEKEWIQISKHKKESHCICGHTIHHYAYVYNIENGHILTIGVGCCKKYGINQSLNNIILLEFFTDSGSLFFKNGFFDINRDIDFIQFLNNKIDRIQKLDKENLGYEIEFYLRETEVLKKNLEELIDNYNFYCGQNILLKTNSLLETLEDYYVQYNVEEQIELQPPVEKENICDIILDEPNTSNINNLSVTRLNGEHEMTDDSKNDICKDIVNEIINKVEVIPTETNVGTIRRDATISYICERCGQCENKKYNFNNPKLNDLLLRADKALEDSPKITMEMKAVMETANYYTNQTSERLRKIKFGLKEIRIGLEELNKNIINRSPA